ncbi:MULTISPECIES: hypothetical protein [unclassified Nocardioides]|uniref:hypothetical protein n=1 Tax=unclassified Nocardioides TaxID=2615069 RepID=UPI0007017FA8|nr:MULTISPECIES: hypothetical protein [unclassified Nocardioides]KRA38314.1 hypothetical protein ASD81_06650 [Nocardioides sp. Root614]KRA92273.1 hypothetical protein ASD84_06915 [Nocardioides sp. Root682]
MNHHRRTRLLLCVAALAAPALLTACGAEKSADADAVAGDPTSTDAVADDLTTDHLLTDDDTVYSDGADWFRTSAFEGDGQDVFNPCARQSLKGTGATSVVRADFELRNTEDPSAAITGDFFVQVVGEYADTAAAEKAWSTVNGWLEECRPRPAGVSDYRSLQTRKVVVPGSDAVITDSHYGPVPKEVDEFGDAAYIMETGVLRKGNRVTVLTSVIIGQDYNFLEGTPVEQMLAPAGEHLDQG